MKLVFFCKETLCEVIKATVIKWGRSTHINDPNLIREMFKLIYNQYDGIGEVKKNPSSEDLVYHIFIYLDLSMS
jgi:hypothetical protein